MESAIGMTAVVAVLLVCLAAVGAGIRQIELVDAAREIARLEARGDAEGAARAVRDLGGSGVDVAVGGGPEPDGRGFVVVELTATVPLLPIRVRARAVAARESGTGDPEAGSLGETTAGGRR